MQHFVQNLQYYLSAEVLGTSWTAFRESVAEAKDLDSVREECDPTAPGNSCP